MAVLTLVVALIAVASWSMLWSGDDYSYLSHFGFADGSQGHFYRVIDFPKFVVSHWLDQNGRMANYIAAILLRLLPERWVMLLNALMTGVMMWLAMRWGGCFGKRTGLCGSLVFMSVLAYGLPWWDSMQVFDCSVNYVWSSAVVLAFLYLYFSDSAIGRFPLWMVCLAGFVSGAMHEAVSFPVLGGLGLYLILTGRWPGSIGRKIALAGFCAGVVWCTFSPGIMSRAFEDIASDDAPVVLVLKSCPVALMLSVVVAVSLCFATGRKNLAMLSRTSWCVFTVAAFLSTGICFVGGIVGRSGWFAEIYALIALWRLAAVYRIRVSRPLGVAGAVVLTSALLVHYVGYAWWQIGYGVQARKVRELYMKSNDGVVCFEDIIYEDSQPWWILAKTRGVPDADDSYQLERFSHYYSHGLKRLVVLPVAEDKRDSLLDELPLMLKNGSMISDTIPASMKVRIHTNQRENSLVSVLTDCIGNEYIATPFRHNGKDFYLISRRIVDPGDR